MKPKLLLVLTLEIEFLFHELSFQLMIKKCPFTIKRRQFPIRPCYAMTIKKSQGQSLKIVGVFLKEQGFSHGQLYVALSRVTSKNGLKIISFDHEGKPSCYAKNIVYKNIIQLLPKGNLFIRCCTFFILRFSSHKLEHL